MGHPVQFFFALIKKIFLQTLVEIIFRYHKIFLGFWDPLGPPYEQNENFYIQGVGYQNRVKRVRGVNFWRNFWEIFNDEDFGAEMFDRIIKFYIRILISSRLGSAEYNNIEPAPFSPTIQILDSMVADRSTLLGDNSFRNHC